MDFKQHPDGHASIYSDTEGKSLFRVGGPASLPTATTGQAPNNFRGVFTVKIPLNGTGSGSALPLATWQNLTPDTLIIKHTVLDITTAQTLTATITVAVGATAVSTTTLLIDTLKVTAAGAYDNITDKGSAGKSRVELPANSWVNVICAAAESATSLVGNLYFDVVVQ